MKDMGIFVIYEHKGNIVLNIHSPNEEDKFSHMNSITLPNMEYVSTMKGKDRLIIVSGREGQTILTELQMISKNIIYGKMLDELHVPCAMRAGETALICIADRFVAGSSLVASS